MVMDVAILFVLILLNGAFAMSEIALVTVRKGRLKALANDEVSGAAAALRLGEKPAQFLSTIQIGITSISILNGIVGEAALAPPLAKYLSSLGLDDKLAHYFATGSVVVLVTYFSIVFGELVPKRLGQLDPEAGADRRAADTVAGARRQAFRVAARRLGRTSDHLAWLQGPQGIQRDRRGYPRPAD
jgi:putative hemolysin